MSDDRLERIEIKLDRIAETLAAKGARDQVTQSDVEVLKKSTKTLKETQDKQKGAVNLITFLSILATIAVAYVEMAKSGGGH